MKNFTKPSTAYQTILDHLYNTYYREGDHFSDVTSSHWKSVGASSVRHAGGGWELAGLGFGGSPERSLTNLLTHLPRLFYSRFLLTKYRCPSFLIRVGHMISRRSNHWFDYDATRQILSLFWIIKALSHNNGNAKQTFRDHGIKRVCVIGDGYGFFTSLLKYIDPSLNVINVNLGRILFFDVFYTQQCCPVEKPTLLTSPSLEGGGASLIFLEAEHMSYLKGTPIDLFVNIASMQEMNPPVIAQYFELMRSSSAKKTYFYCCNRIEKKLPNSTVVRFQDYPWRDSKIIFDELCPWYQQYPVSRPPFLRKFDGPVQHRLVCLNE